MGTVLIDNLATTQQIGWSGSQIYEESDEMVFAIGSAEIMRIQASQAYLSQLGFNLTAGLTVGEGQLAWNASEGTLDLGLIGGNVINEIGQELVAYVKATEAISDGDVVYVSGAVGASGKLEVSKFIADGTILSYYLIGIATESITSGSSGYIATFGKIHGIPTNGSAVGEVWVDGDPLYASPTTAGKLTKVKPVAPNLTIPIAFVVNAHASNGTLMEVGHYISDTPLFTSIHTSEAAYIHHTISALTDNAGAGAGTLTNAPTAGNPTKWIAIDDNGTDRYIPTWT